MVQKGCHPPQCDRRAKKAQERLEQREVRGYEASYVHALWHLDFHKAWRNVVDSNGVWHTAEALAILDDRSRVCNHIQWYLSETAESLYHGLMQAFHKRGLPRAIMSDNGAAMTAWRPRTACCDWESFTIKPFLTAPIKMASRRLFGDRWKGV